VLEKVEIGDSHKKKRTENWNTENYSACLFILISLNMIGVSIAFGGGGEIFSLWWQRNWNLFSL
jgi:exopolysaccharide biosynthesis predicted pyruvyltransferase EpsI